MVRNDQERPKGQKPYLKCESGEIITEKKRELITGQDQASPEDHLRIAVDHPRTTPGPPEGPPENHPRERGSVGRGTTISIEGQGATGGNTTKTTTPTLHMHPHGGDPRSHGKSISGPKWRFRGSPWSLVVVYVSLVVSGGITPVFSGQILVPSGSSTWFQVVSRGLHWSAVLAFSLVLSLFPPPKAARLLFCGTNRVNIQYSPSREVTRQRWRLAQWAEQRDARSRDNLTECSFWPATHVAECFLK